MRLATQKELLERKLNEIRDELATDWCIEYGVYNKEHFAYQAGFDAGCSKLLPLLLDAYEALDAIDKALTIPAAEYVPAIGDVFKIIDSVRPRIETFANGEK